jgi:hypothetical protein
VCRLLPNLARWVLDHSGSWLVMAGVAIVILYLVLRILRRAVTASLRLALIAGTLVVIAVALLVLSNLLRSRGLALP